MGLKEVYRQGRFSVVEYVGFCGVTEFFVIRDYVPCITQQQNFICTFSSAIRAIEFINFTLQSSIENPKKTQKNSI